MAGEFLATVKAINFVNAMVEKVGLTRTLTSAAYKIYSELGIRYLAHYASEQKIREENATLVFAPSTS